jgi:hypothetical protein
LILDGPKQSLGEQLSLVVTDDREEDDKLVSSYPGTDVGHSRSRLDDSGDLLQSFVARLVSERVVDSLEVVDVQQHHPTPRSVAPQEVDLTLGLGLERAAIE